MSPANDLARDLEAVLQQRIGEDIPTDSALEKRRRIEPIVKHRVIRRYSAIAGRFEPVLVGRQIGQGSEAPPSQ